MNALRPFGLMVTCIATLSACSSNNQGVSVLLKDLISIGDAAEPDPKFIAYDLENAPAYIVWLESKNQSYSLIAHQTTNSKGEETWISPYSLSFGMKDGMIIASRGLGGDQLAGDPSQTIAALKSRQNRITDRFVTLLNGENQAETLAFRCAVTYQGKAAVPLSPTYTASTDYYEEACRNGHIAFTNQFWIEQGSQKIVRSRQWISETNGALGLLAVPR